MHFFLGFSDTYWQSCRLQPTQAPLPSSMRACFFCFSHASFELDELVLLLHKNYSWVRRCKILCEFYAAHKIKAQISASRWKVSGTESIADQRTARLFRRDITLRLYPGEKQQDIVMLRLPSNQQRCWTGVLGTSTSFCPPYSLLRKQSTVCEVISFNWATMIWSITLFRISFCVYLLLNWSIGL